MTDISEQRSSSVQIEGFDGRVAFVTGGAQGIGLGIARALAKVRVKIAIVDVNQEALAAAEAELAQKTEVVAAVLDVRDRDAYATLADEVETRLGPVTLLFNNAGVVGETSTRRMSYQAWDWVIGVNLHGVYNGLHTFVPRMIERGGGYVVNTASGAGLVAQGTGFVYATSKFAVVGLSEALRAPLARHHVGVSVLCPGPVATHIFRHSAQLRPASDPPSTAERERRAVIESWLTAGTATPPDAVGEMVLDAMRAGRLHIYTDDIMAEPIKRRTQQLLDALPSALAR
jgi:NAD(P)-dependent dehydrogenase (short-subunit alcohol dehydrogenase family)